MSNRISKLFFILLLSPLFTMAQPVVAVKKPATEKGFTITGDINGLVKGTVVKLVNANTNTELAATMVSEKKVTVKKNGKLVSSMKSVFVLKGKMTEPDLCLVSIGDMKPYNIYAENSAITITGSNGAMDKWVVKGSASHKDFQDFEKTFTPLAQKLNTAGNTINNTAPGPQRDAMITSYTALQKDIQTTIDSFITVKKSSYVSPFVLLVMMGFNDDPNTAETRFNKLDTAVQGSYIGKILANQIADGKIGAVGTQALNLPRQIPPGIPFPYHHSGVNMYWLISGPAGAAPAGMRTRMLCRTIISSGIRILPCWVYHWTDLVRKING